MSRQVRQASSGRNGTLFRHLLTQWLLRNYDAEVENDVRHRARLHAALGDQHRLAIVEELSVSDRSPGDLGRMFGLPTNLLAHHLDVLDEVGLIDRLISAGDRRRRYIRLRRAPLVDLDITAARQARTALFVCSHNSARSQLAAALWKARTGRPATSAGTHPAARMHPGAIAAARRAGIDVADARPRALVPTDRADVVVTVCDRAHEEIAPGPDWLHWSVPDPVEVGTDAAFDAVVADLDDRIRSLS